MKLPSYFGMLSVALAMLFATPSHSESSDSNNHLKSLASFDIASAPSKADWKFFIHAPERTRLQLWEKHSRSGKRLEHWNWGWRLGWVRVCGASEQGLCQHILRQALFDKALVVRSEAASRLGSRFAGSAQPEVVALLEQAYANKQNLRAGRPLFVQQRILYALYQVGDEAQRLRAQALAAKYRDTKAYWQRLVAATEAAD